MRMITRMIIRRGIDIAGPYLLTKLHGLVLVFV